MSTLPAFARRAKPEEKCRVNEEFLPSSCDNVCSGIAPKCTNPHKGCFCKEGFVRNAKTNTCTLKSRCPRITSTTDALTTTTDAPTTATDLTTTTNAPTTTADPPTTTNASTTTDTPTTTTLPTTLPAPSCVTVACQTSCITNDRKIGVCAGTECVCRGCITSSACNTLCKTYIPSSTGGACNVSMAVCECN